MIFPHFKTSRVSQLASPNTHFQERESTFFFRLSSTCLLGSGTWSQWPQPQTCHATHSKVIQVS